MLTKVASAQKCYVLTFHNKITTSCSVCHRATKSMDSFFLLPEPYTPLMMCCWVASLTTAIILRERRRLSRPLKKMLQKYVTSNHRCRALGARGGEVTRATAVLHLLVCEHLYKISVAQMFSYFRREGKES